MEIEPLAARHKGTVQHSIAKVGRAVPSAPPPHRALPEFSIIQQQRTPSAFHQLAGDSAPYRGDGRSLRRRDFIVALAVFGVSAATVLPANAARPRRSTARNTENIIDTNVSLFHWPFRRLPLDGTARLAAKLKDTGIAQAWAGSFEALLHKNLGAVNEALARECRKHGSDVLLPFGSVNPTLPDWEEELRRCHEQHEMYGIRLFPNYHGYKLDDPEFLKLLAAAESRGLIVQIALSMEDERVQHPLVRVPNVDAAPLAEALEKVPKLKVVLLNWFRCVKAEELKKLAKSKQIWFDIAMVEGVGGIANLLRDVPVGQILFGSHAPFFYLESALLKLKESPLAANVSALIRQDNATRLLQ